MDGAVPVTAVNRRFIPINPRNVQERKGRTAYDRRVRRPVPGRLGAGVRSLLMQVRPHASQFLTPTRRRETRLAVAGRERSAISAPGRFCQSSLLLPDPD